VRTSADRTRVAVNPFTKLGSFSIRFEAQLIVRADGGVVDGTVKMHGFLAPSAQSNPNEEAKRTRRPGERACECRWGRRAKPRCGLAILLLAAALLCAPCRAHYAELTRAGSLLSLSPCPESASTWTWLRRAVAPSASLAERAGCGGAPAFAVPPAASGANLRSLPLAAAQGVRAKKVRGSSRPQWEMMMRRAFAPTHKTEQIGGQGGQPIPARKLSRVSVDEILEFKSSPHSRVAAQRSMGIRGGGVARRSEMSRCASGTGATAPLGEAVRTPLAFTISDSANNRYWPAWRVGSRGCSRDWKQLVQSAVSAGQDGTTRLSSDSRRRPRPRPFRLSRTVEVEVITLTRLPASA